MTNNYWSGKTSKTRAYLLRAIIAVVELPLTVASATTWWLEGLRTRLRTALAIEEERE